MKWLETTGGPFVLMARDDVPHWTGHKDDYWNLIELEDVTSVIEFGPEDRRRSAFVLADEPLRTTWLPEYQTFLQWRYAESEAALLEMVRSRFADAEWADGPSLELAGPAVLFDAATPGEDLNPDDKIEIRLDRGTYRLCTADLEPGRGAAARLHRLVLQR
ncbi:MAG: Imm21 family immunity protein [Actinomycetes bacterium]|jgi:hypothetical protein|nr:MAG: hypothetical protein DIU60_11165 [Actinomycetota bacterium]